MTPDDDPFWEKEQAAAQSRRGLVWVLLAVIGFLLFKILGGRAPFQ